MVPHDYKYPTWLPPQKCTILKSSTSTYASQLKLLQMIRYKHGESTQGTVKTGSLPNERAVSEKKKNTIRFGAIWFALTCNSITTCHYSCSLQFCSFFKELLCLLDYQCMKYGASNVIWSTLSSKSKLSIAVACAYAIARHQRCDMSDHIVRSPRFCTSVLASCKGS